MKNIRIIAVAFVFSVLLSATQVHAATIAVHAGDLVKGTDPTVYFITNDEKRLAFPDEATFKSWYPNFAQVKVVANPDLTKFPLIGNVQVRPGVVMVKAKSDSKVYAVSKGAILHWIPNPTIANMIYGSYWSRNVATVPDATFANYRIGPMITGPNQYWWKTERDAALSIDMVSPPRLPVVTTVSANVGGPTLTLKAVIVNGNDGRFNANPTDTKFFIESLPVKHGVANVVATRDYTLYYTKIPGYIASNWGGDCTAVGTVGIRSGDNKTCTITFTYDPVAARLPTLQIRVLVLNNDNTTNTAISDDFVKFIGGQLALNDTPYAVAPGHYRMIISSRNGYSASDWGGDCDADGFVDVELGEHKTCTIVEDDIPKTGYHATMGELVLRATIINKQGGTKKPSDVTLSLEGKSVTSGQVNSVDPRDYTVYHSTLSGYSASSWGGDCLPGGTVHVGVNEYRVCTVTFVQQ